MKNQRQQKIMEIIDTNAVETQEELADRLRSEGFPSTQATISRDIKELRLVKAMNENGRYRYAPPVPAENTSMLRLRTIFRESVSSYQAAQNLVVLKTLPGLAPAACSALDSMQIEGLVGTLAGDDTCFLALVDNKAANNLINIIMGMVKP